MGIFGSLFTPDIEKLRARGDVRGLIKALRSKEVWVKAVDALEAIGTPEAAEGLLAHIDDFDRYLGLAVAKALARMRHPRAVPALIRMLGGDSDDIRCLTAKVLGELKEASAVAPLIAQLKCRSKYVRLEAVRALDRIGNNEAAGPISACLMDEESEVRRAAASALRELRDPSAVDGMIAALKVHPDNDTLWLLGSTGDSRAVDSLIGYLKSGDRQMASTARDFLSGSLYGGDPRAVAAREQLEAWRRAEEEREASQRQEEIESAHKRYEGTPEGELVRLLVASPDGPEVRPIGHELNRRGGEPLMLSVHKKVVQGLLQRTRSESAQILREHSLEYDQGARRRAGEVAQAQAATDARDIERAWDGIGGWLG